MSHSNISTNDCMLYAQYTDKDGYGKRTYQGDDKRSVCVYVHRVMYEQYKGPIPAGRQIDHLCRTPTCINPDHLEAVTPRVNVRRGEAFKTHCPLGHEYTDTNTRYTQRKDGYRTKRCRLCDLRVNRRLRWPTMA